jgi:hypothetical protein
VSGVSIKKVRSANLIDVSDQTFNIFRYTFSGAVNFSNFGIGNFITISGAATPANNGTFRIVGISQVSKYLDLYNSAGVADATDQGSIDLTLNLHALATFPVEDDLSEVDVSLAHDAAGVMKRIAVTDAATVAIYSGSGNLAGRESILVRNVGTGSVYLDFVTPVLPGTSSSDVTVPSFLLKIDECLEIDLGPNLTLYAKCATGATSTLHIIEVS